MLLANQASYVALAVDKNSVIAQLHKNKMATGRMQSSQTTVTLFKHLCEISEGEVCTDSVRKDTIRPSAPAESDGSPASSLFLTRPHWEPAGTTTHTVVRTA